MSASNSSGIQALLEAEKTAQESVQQARTFRVQRLKAAKTDASKEIEAYKAKKEQEFKERSVNFEKVEGNKESVASTNAEAAVKELKKSADKGRENVIKYLVEQVTTV